MESNCIFCKINAGEIPGDFVYRDDDAFVIQGYRPPRARAFARHSD